MFIRQKFPCGKQCACVNRWIIVMEWDTGIRLSNQKCKIVEMACVMKSTYSQLGISIFLMKLSRYLNSETADFLLMSLSFHRWLCMKTRSTFTRGWWRLHWRFHKFKVCVLRRSTLSVFHSKLLQTCRFRNAYIWHSNIVNCLASHLVILVEKKSCDERELSLLAPDLSSNVGRGYVALWWEASAGFKDTVK